MGRNACSLADLFHGTHTCSEIHTQLTAEPLPASAAVSSDEDGDPQNIALQGSVRRKKKAKYASSERDLHAPVVVDPPVDIRLYCSVGNC